MSTVKIAGVQMDVVFGDKAANLSRIEERLREAAGQGAALIVFPECALTGYGFASLAEGMRLAEPIPGPSTRKLAELCSELGVHAVVGMLESDGDRLFNATALIGPKGVVGGYRKVHLPYLGIDKFATPGDRPFAVVEAAGVRVGMLICYDLGFPEAARVLTLLGADVIVLPTNWPPKSECAADHLVNARAAENVVYVAAVNRIGTESGFRFIGKSKIADPNGDPLASADHSDEAILYADVDVQFSRTKRLIRVPGKHEIDRIKDRRPEMYSLLVDPDAGR